MPGWLDQGIGWLLKPLALLARHVSRPQESRQNYWGASAVPISLNCWSWEDPLEESQWRRWNFHLLAHVGNLERGEVALVGPILRPISDPPLDAEDPGFHQTPGIISPTTNPLRACSWVALEREFAARRSLRADVGLVVRFATLSLLPRARYFPAAFKLLGVRVDNLTMQEALDQMLEWASQDRPHQVSFVNAHCFNVAHDDGAYRQVLLDCPMVLPDGSGVRLGALVQGIGVKENVNGTDMFPLLCRALAGQGKSLYLLGAGPEVAARVAQWLAVNVSDLKVVGYRDGFFSAQEDGPVAEAIRQTGAHVLMVAMGVPRQEIWLAKNQAATGCPVALGVGGLFDFFSGRIPRAPQWLRRLGLEWTWRLYQEPGRMWRRYLVGNVVFWWRVEQETRRIKIGGSPS